MAFAGRRCDIWTASPLTDTSKSRKTLPVPPVIPPWTCTVRSPRCPVTWSNCVSPSASTKRPCSPVKRSGRKEFVRLTCCALISPPAKVIPSGWLSGPTRRKIGAAEPSTSRDAARTRDSCSDLTVLERNCSRSAAAIVPAISISSQGPDSRKEINPLLSAIWMVP